MPTWILFKIKKNTNIQNKYKSPKISPYLIWKKIWTVYRPRSQSLYTGFRGSGITYLNYSQLVISAENLIFKYELIFPTFETQMMPGTPLLSHWDKIWAHVFSHRTLNFYIGKKSAEKFSYGFKNLVKLGVENFFFKIPIGRTVFNFSCKTSVFAGLDALFE